MPRIGGHRRAESLPDPLRRLADVRMLQQLDVARAPVHRHRVAGEGADAKHAPRAQELRSTLQAGADGALELEVTVQM